MADDGYSKRVGIWTKPVKAALIGIAGVLFALAPLIAQYYKQQTMVSGDNFALVSPLAPLHGTVARHHPHKAHARAKRVAQVHHKRPAQRTVVALVPRQKTLPAHRALLRHAVHRRIVAHRRAPVRVAFKPRHQRHRRRAAPIVAQFDPARERVRSAVVGYLERVISGEIPDAPEKRIVSAWTDIHVAFVRPQEDGRMNVGVNLRGPQGRFFEVFAVDRSDLQILQHSIVQV